MQALALSDHGSPCPARALSAHDTPEKDPDPQAPPTGDEGAQTLAGNDTPYGTGGAGNDPLDASLGTSRHGGGAGDDRLISFGVSHLIGNAANDIFRPDVNDLSGHPTFADRAPRQSRLRFHCPAAGSQPLVSLTPDPSVNGASFCLEMVGVRIGIAPGDSVPVPKAPT